MRPHPRAGRRAPHLKKTIPLVARYAGPAARGSPTRRRDTQPSSPGVVECCDQEGRDPARPVESAVIGRPFATKLDLKTGDDTSRMASCSSRQLGINGPDYPTWPSLQPNGSAGATPGSVTEPTPVVAVRDPAPDRRQPQPPLPGGARPALRLLGPSVRDGFRRSLPCRRQPISRAYSFSEGQVIGARRLGAAWRRTHRLSGTAPRTQPANVVGTRPSDVVLDRRRYAVRGPRSRRRRCRCARRPPRWSTTAHPALWCDPGQYERPSSSRLSVPRSAHPGEPESRGRASRADSQGTPHTLDNLASSLGRINLKTPSSVRPSGRCRSAPARDGGRPARAARSW